MRNEIAVTGIGVFSPIGNGRDHYWNALKEGKKGFRQITVFDSAALSVHVAGEVDFDPVALLGKKGLRDLDRSTRLLSAAALAAVDDAKLLISDDNSHDAGVSVGSTFGSLHSISQFDRSGLIEGPRMVNPSHFPNTVLNSPASRVSIRLNIKGFNTTISTGCCSGLDAIAYAADFIRLKRADVVLAGGVEELCEETLLFFEKMGYLSGADGSDPLCCPFDARRKGTILSEGAAVLVLEDMDHALNRGAEILALVKGCGNAFSSERPEAGLAAAMRAALNEAVATSNDIGYIAASANGTARLDAMETRAIREVFGELAGQVPVSAVKSMCGETYSASGALAVAAAAGALKEGFLPPTVNYREKDPECDLDYIPNEARQVQAGSALVTASDPRGNSAAVVLERYGAQK